MDLIRVHISTTTECSELVADLLFNLGSSGVSIEDKNDVIQLYKSNVIWDYIDEKLLEKSEIVTVIGFFDEETYASVKVDIINELDAFRAMSEFECGSLEVTVDRVNDTDWLEQWKKFYAPIDCGNIIIVPEWIKFDDNNKTIVKIDPGVAFGTGEHETTKCCLKLLDELDINGKTVLDIGCGSGILGIAAAKKGASHVVAFDIDEIAVEAAIKNAKLNGVLDVMTISQGDLLNGSQVKADVILANITADILILLSKDIIPHLNDGGVVILSGIIHKRLDDVVQAYAKLGIKIERKLILGEWCALRLI